MTNAQAGRPQDRGRHGKREVEVPAQLVYCDRVDPDARATIVSFNEAQRVGNAVISGLSCWGLAVVSIFVPLGHFVLVPAFLIAGPVLFFLRLAEGVSLLGARGKCPMCGREQDFAERGRLLTKHPVRCANCGRELELVVAVAGREATQGRELSSEAGSPRVWTGGGGQESG
jgi:hypothetical protein